MPNLFVSGAPKFKATGQPCCPECLAIVQPRLDGLLPNHRDQQGDPCPGSHKKPIPIKRRNPNAPRDK